MKDMNELVEAYLTIRNERDRIEADYKERDLELKSEMVVLEQAMLAGCNEMKVESLRTNSGTVIKSLKERIVIGSFTSIGQNVCIVDFNHSFTKITSSFINHLLFKYVPL